MTSSSPCVGFSSTDSIGAQSAEHVEGVLEPEHEAVVPVREASASRTVEDDTLVAVKAEAVDNGVEKAVESAIGVDGRADGDNGNSKVEILAFGEIGACGNKACGFISIMDRFVVDLSWLGFDCTGSVSETTAEHAEVVTADSA